MTRKELDKIFYSLCYDDIAMVAETNGVELTDEEIRRVGHKYENHMWAEELGTLIDCVVEEREFK